MQRQKATATTNPQQEHIEKEKKEKKEKRGASPFFYGKKNEILCNFIERCILILGLGIADLK
jgi:hypothetical protein